MTLVTHDSIARHRVPRLIAALAALCLALTGLTIQAAQAADTGSITGQVITQSVGGAKTPVVSSYIYSEFLGDDPDAVANSIGHSFEGSAISMTGLADGYYRLEIADVQSADGSDGWQREYYNNGFAWTDATLVHIVGGAPVTLDDIVIEKPGQISGTVTDAAGNPMADASVMFTTAGGHGAGWGVETDAQGHYSSGDGLQGRGGLVGGNYTVSASKYPDNDHPDDPAYNDTYWPNSSSEAGSTPVTVTPGSTHGNVNFQLKAAPRIKLTVKDPEGHPVPNAEIGIWTFYEGSWQPYQAGPNLTDADGAFRKVVSVGDRYKFYVDPPAGVGGVTEWYSDKYSEETATEVDATVAGQVIDITIQLGAAPAVEGSTPVITGTPTVGQTLTATPGTWGPTGVHLTYQWYADNTKIASATTSTFTPTLTEIRKALTVKVTGTLSPYTPTTIESSATEHVSAQTITAGAPTISGVTTAGRTLTVKPGVWGPNGTKLGYQWFANNVPIARATGTAFKLTNAQAGRRITARVTGTLAGAAPVTKGTAFTAAVKGVLVTRAVSISGTRKVGRTLRADTHSWGPTPVTLSYKWYRNGHTISGQKARHYKLHKADKGKHITVRVYQRKTYYTTLSRLSPKTGKIRK